jgi:NifU-like protein involved in Fe-S cluster formation
VRRLFLAPDHGGVLPAGLRAACQAPGVSIELSMQAQDGYIRALRFRALACPHVIAAAEAFCRGWEGRSISDLEEFRAVELVQSLPVPVEKTGRILVLEDAVRALLATATENEIHST